MNGDLGACLQLTCFQCKKSRSPTDSNDCSQREFIPICVNNCSFCSNKKMFLHLELELSPDDQNAIVTCDSSLLTWTIAAWGLVRRGLLQHLQKGGLSSYFRGVLPSDYLLVKTTQRKIILWTLRRLRARVGWLRRFGRRVWHWLCGKPGVLRFLFATRQLKSRTPGTEDVT